MSHRRGVPVDLEQQARLLAEVTQGFASSLNLQHTLRNAITRFSAYLDAEAASVFLLEADGAELVCYDCVGPVDVTGLRLDAGEGIVGKAVRLNQTQMVRDVSEDPDFAASIDAGTGFVTRSVLCVPLSIRGEPIGALELINKSSGDGLFDEQDFHLATVIAAAASLAIHNARMAEALVEQERVRKEFELAREIQLSLLPEPVRGGLPVGGVNVPAREVSGDFYDYMLLPEGRWYFSIGDVAGKGMNAALLMARTTSLLRCLAREHLDPGQLMARVNEELCETASRGLFVTAICGFYEPELDRVRFTNAGHPPLLHRLADGTIDYHYSAAPPLGVVADTRFPSVDIELGGGTLFLYTDGVTEARAADGALLGVEGFARMLREVPGGGIEAEIEALVGALARAGWESSDDLTLLALRAR